ncbi:MAG: peptidoglycan-binding protein, partial [Eubacteriales bacterium]|nr:peptidoglycan-binding protein [Eubacteriales bacterium]
YGDSGQDVVQLQKALKKLGYFDGKIGGNYLDLTQAAVQDFEYARGYKLTWYCTAAMQEKIYDASQKKPPQPERTLHYGDSGDDVKALQKALKKLGYFDGNIGGNYLKQTRQAVKDFQEDYGYKLTNYCTVAMQGRIRKAAK